MKTILAGLILALSLPAADLVDTAAGAGPFTVFAPTDEAFAKLPKETLDALMANPEKLAAVLKYHVVAGKVKSAEARTGKVATLEGSSARLLVKEGRVMIDEANVIQPDIESSNGVIHAIDAVILPPSMK